MTPHVADPDTTLRLLLRIDDALSGLQGQSDRFLYEDVLLGF